MEASKAHCELCDVDVSSEGQLETHVQGKRHLKKAAERDAFRALAARSVFVCGLPLKFFTDEKQVKSAMETFGAIDRVCLDAHKGSYAIVEFRDQQSAANAISLGKFNFGEQTALLRERKVEFDSSQAKFERSTIDVDAVLREAGSAGPAYETSIDRLMELFCLSREQRAQRLLCADELTAALREYFSSDMCVRVFGSSISSIGTVDSDVDASVFFGDSPLSKSDSEFCRNKYSLMTSDVGTLRCRLVQADEFARLTPADRVRLLTKILNDIRRRGLAPISDQRPILDARCPLVRFLYDRKFTIDLSVDNRLGLAKSTWIKAIVSSDVSSTFRRFFASIRFWALASGLMKGEENTRGHFNAYILNLLCVVFLQLRSYVQPLQRGAVAEVVDGWHIDFSVPTVDLSHVSVASLIKEFFVWFIQAKLKGNVFCPRLGSSLTAEEFADAFPDKVVKEYFKISFLCVQDPLELCHNVAQLVSEKYISGMRREMMLAVSRIKADPHSFIALFHPQSLQRTSDLHVFVEAGGLTSVVCLESVANILMELLAFELVERGPNAKRMRLDGDSSRCDETMDFEISGAVWAGRRNKRRAIAKLQPQLSEWDLEKTVTKELCGAGATLRVRIAVAKEGHRAVVRLVLLAGSEQHLHNLSHFLSQFLPKYFPDSVSRCARQTPMEE